VTPLTFRGAISTAIGDELRSDHRVLLFGEDVAAAGGVFKATEGLFAEFGPVRVRDTPISEVAIVGAAIGAAITGMRPVIDLMFADFLAVCFDQVVNQAAKHRYLTGGQCSVPITVRMANGAGAGFGAQHSQSVDSWLYGTHGLMIVAPSGPVEAYGLLRSAIQEPNPVVFLEHKTLYGMTEEIDGDLAPVPLRQARIVRPGTDVTLVATQVMLHRALEAANALESTGLSAEVIDLRTVWPPDVDTVAASVARTNRLVVVEECPADAGWAASLIMDIIERQFDVFDAAPQRVSADPTPIPYSPELERAWMPAADRIAAAARSVVS
jgi:pyruvate/2-oxoglutarate/acetoin dehydrogenase E1 component